MPLLCTRRRWWLRLGLAATLAASLSACGADRVETVAREQALDRLQDNLTETVTCLNSVAPQFDPALGQEALADVLAPCADVSILNRDDDYILSDRVELPAGAESIAVAGTFSDERVRLQLVAQGSALAEAGVASARVQLVTCWGVAVDTEAGRLEDYTGVACKGSVLERINPVEEVTFSDLHIPGV